MTNEQLAIILNNIRSELQEARMLMEYGTSEENLDNFHKYKNSIRNIEEKLYEHVQTLVGR